jgi:peptide chain release factor
VNQMEKVFLQLTSGRGPRECAYVVAQLLSIISKEAILSGITYSLIDSETSGGGPMPEAKRSAMVRLEGLGAEAFAEKWLGTIKWIGTSPYRPTHSRKNWFVGVSVVAPPMQARRLDGKIAIETMRASGPGGQNVNKTNSAVRVTHVDSGISVTARESRSQVQNQKMAYQRLQKLFDQERESLEKLGAGLKWADHQGVERGNPKRTFRGIGFVEI